jgi:hypothetical protein
VALSAEEKPYGVDDVRVALAAEQTALRRWQALQAREQLATVCRQLQRARMRGVELAQLGARERCALAGELLQAFADLAHLRRSQRWRVVLGAQRGALLDWFAGLVTGECELAVVSAAGGWELFDREVLIVAIEHPPTRTAE